MTRCGCARYCAVEENQPPNWRISGFHAGRDDQISRVRVTWTPCASYTRRGLTSSASDMTTAQSARQARRRTRPCRSYGMQCTPVNRRRGEEEETYVRMLRSRTFFLESGISPSLLEALGGIRRGADRLLETQSVSPATVDHWEMAVDIYEHLRMTAPPTVLLTQLLSDFAELQQILSCRQPLDFQRRLYYVMARFAGMIGLTLVDNTDDRAETQAWFHTARLAADEADDRILRAWVTVCESASYLWYGRPAARASEKKEALAQQDQAFRVSPAVPAHRVLVALDRASCLAHAGDLDEGCRTANQFLVKLPADHCSGIVLFRAKEVAAAATLHNTHLGPVRELRETLRAAGAFQSRT